MKKRWGKILLFIIADIVILGGSFVPNGGHNPIEPAFFHTRLISGPYIFNQEALFASIKGYTIVFQDKLSQTLKDFESLPYASLHNVNHKLQTLLDAII